MTLPGQVGGHPSESCRYSVTPDDLKIVSDAGEAPGGNYLGGLKSAQTSRTVKKENLKKNYREIRMLRVIWITIAMSGFLFGTVATARIHFVPAEYDSIQTAIDSSVDGDTVLINPGLYVERINLLGKNIVIGSLMLMTGDDSYIRRTIIDGDSLGSVVTIPPGSDNRTVISGLTIQNGGRSRYGGGVNCTGSWPILEYLLVQRCGSREGGGIFVDQDSTIVRYSTMYANLATSRGSGIFMSGGILSKLNFIDNRNGALSCTNRPVVEDCYFEGTTGTYRNSCVKTDNAVGRFSRLVIQYNYCEAIGCDNDASLFENILVQYNVGEDCGGAGFANSTTIINRALFTNNFSLAGGRSSALGFFSSANVLLSNVTVIAGENSGTSLILFNLASMPRFVNSIIDRNDAGLFSFFNGPPSGVLFAYCCFPDSGGLQMRNGDHLEWLEGNIFADPGYINPETGDYRLQEDSPCIDAGVAEFAWHGLRILDIPPDLYAGAGPDIGWHEFGWANRVPFNNAPPIMRRLLSNYPNPFNSTTTVSFDIYKPGFVRLTVYDLNGAKITSLIEEHFTQGNYRYEWNAGSFPSGTYLLNLESAGNTLSRPIMLVK